jgi:hypothetical protein
VRELSGIEVEDVHDQCRHAVERLVDAEITGDTFSAGVFVSLTAPR